MSENYQYVECKHCGQSLMGGQIHSCKKMMLAEIEELKICVENWKTLYDSAAEDAQELQGVVNEIRAELQSRAIHLLSKHCWCDPTGYPWIQKGTVTE